jgi:hypothetical protein
MNHFGTLKADVLDWATERDLLTTGTIEGQVGKFAEEAAETVFAAGQYDLVGNASNKNKFMDGIGDTLVTLIILSELAGVNPEDCLKMAYDEIKARTGKTVGGKFVKDQ